MTRRDVLAVAREVWGSSVASVECNQRGATVVVVGAISLTDVIRLVTALGVDVDQTDLLAISAGRSGVSIDVPSQAGAVSAVSVPI